MGRQRLLRSMDTKVRNPIHEVGVNLSYTVSRGEDAGVVLTPHRDRNGMLVASRGRFGPHYYVADEADLICHLKRGWSIRMSNRKSKLHRGPCLITAASIK